MAIARHQVQGIAFDFIQALADLVAVAHARLGEAHAALGAAKQLQAQEFFQRGHLAADGALRHGHFLRGLGKALVPRGRLEDGHGLGGRNLSAHRAKKAEK